MILISFGFHSIYVMAENKSVISGRTLLFLLLIILYNSNQAVDRNAIKILSVKTFGVNTESSNRFLTAGTR
jgi:hypothetical protein